MSESKVGQREPLKVGETRPLVVERKVISEWKGEVDRCYEEGTIQGLPVKKGDTLIVRVKGRTREEINAEFQCYNRIFGTIVIKLKDGSLMLIKPASIIYILKPPLSHS